MHDCMRVFPCSALGTISIFVPFLTDSYAKKKKLLFEFTVINYSFFFSYLVIEKFETLKLDEFDLTDGM